MRTNDLTEAEVFGPIGYLATCLAHIRTGHEINLIEYGCIAVAPLQVEVDNARHMVDVLANLRPRERS
ncbi:hypothetical protein [Streptomyces sp. NBC_01092]|uniref:hypothetical protein n=1 Tax=Streptomyces sp. NBC_01092 TaxID=2903748 RepID=UPI00386FE8F4|nr:hypothetical protein OG254_12495 [Streptomyces sp. NBC_01092]